MGTMWSQIFPPTPPLTEANLPRQDGKTFIVTGGASGIGMELCALLYRAGGKVYMAGRSEANAQASIKNIKTQPAANPGELKFMQLSLQDLTTIKPAVDRFISNESRLDVLFNNAGVSNPGIGAVGAQGHDLTTVTNCFGPYLLTQLLLPILIKTARAASPGDVRVVWTSSIVTDLVTSKNVGLEEMIMPNPDEQQAYYRSKTGNWFLAGELSLQVGGEGIISVAVNPGNLKTQILRHVPKWVQYLLWPFFYEAKMGAYTELWAGLSSSLVIEDGGKFIVPWGRLHPSPREDLLAALKSKDQGGTGVATAFVEHCDRQVEEYK